MSLELAHEEIIREESLSIADLPKAIRQSIQGVNMQIAKYRKTPTPALANTIKSVSVRIADEIQDWIEEAIDEEAEIQKENQDREAKEREKAETEAKEKAETEAKEKAETEAKEKAEREGNFGNPFLKGIFGI